MTVESDMTDEEFDELRSKRFRSQHQDAVSEPSNKVAPTWWNPRGTPEPWWNPPKPETEPPGLGAIDYVGGAAGDLSLQGITGVPAMVAGGWAGIGSALTQSGESGNVARDWMEELAYQPRSKGGKAVNAAIDVPLNAMMQFADDQGEKALWNYGDPSPMRATAVRSTLEAVPLVAGAILGKNMRPPMGTKKPKVPSSTKQTEPSLRTEPPIAPEVEPTLTPRQQVKPETATDRAQAMAEKAGIPWNQLSTNMKRRIGEIAKDAVDFESVNKEQLARIMRAESLPVPITLRKGQITRDPQQMRIEEMAASGAGLEAQPIRDQMVAFNRGVAANLAEIKARTGAKIKPGGQIPSEQAGKRIAASLEQKQLRSENKVTRAYNKADKSAEGATPVDGQPIVDWIIANESEATLAPAINVIRDNLKKRNLIRVEPDGEVVVLRKFQLREMEGIRKKANQLWDPSYNGKFMGDLKRLIDKTTENSGGDLYKGARAERVRHRVEHEDPGSVANLLALKKGNTDRKVSFEKVHDNIVLNGSLQQLRNTKKALLEFESDSSSIRKNGRDAWEELAGATVGYIEGETITKIVAKGYGGEPVASTAALKKALDKIGDEKLELLLGKSGKDKLRQLEQVLRDQEIPPFKGSPTAPFLLAYAEKVFDGLTAIIPSASGKIVARGVKEVAKQAAEKGRVAGSAKGSVLTDEAFPIARAGEKVQTGPSMSAVERVKPKKKSKKATRKPSPPSRISPMIPLSALAIPTTDQERKLAPFYSQNVTIDRARTGSIGRGK